MPRLPLALAPCPSATGALSLPIPADALPSGVCLVRVEAGGVAKTQALAAAR